MSDIYISIKSTAQNTITFPKYLIDPNINVQCTKNYPQNLTENIFAKKKEQKKPI